MNLSISLDSIYLGSLCKISAILDSPFKMVLSSRIVNISKGKFDSAVSLASTEDKGKHSIETTVLGMLEEVLSGYGRQSGSRHGMSFFPFVSSDLILDFDSDIECRSVTLEIPATFRVIWGNSKCTSACGARAKLTSSMGEKTSIYVFSWEQPVPPGRHSLRVRIRMGGATLMRLAYFPVLYYFVALMAIYAGTSIGSGATVAAISASWMFMLRHLNTSELPRRACLLFYSVLISGLFLPIWGVIVFMNKYYYNEPFILGVCIFIFVAAAYSIHSIKSFEQFGILPKAVRKTWSCIVTKLESKSIS